MTQGLSPGGPPSPFRSGRCACCGEALHGTKVAGRPQREDHELGCEFSDRAVQVMRYVDELERAASELAGRQASRSDRRRKYLQKSTKELTAAACADDPVLAIGRLADQYAAETKKGAEPDDIAEILMHACQALAQGRHPATITKRPPPYQEATPAPFGPGRCVECGGALHRTLATRRPQQEDHTKGCQRFYIAVQIMRYVDELERAAPELERPTSRIDRRRQRILLHDSVREMSAAACADDPVLAIGRLADQYAAETKKGAEPDDIAEILMHACQALADGGRPEPIIRALG
jgi:hypothetical protein